MTCLYCVGSMEPRMGLQCRDFVCFVGVEAFASAFARASVSVAIMVRS
jgi:hypothetical protein